MPYSYDPPRTRYLYDPDSDKPFAVSRSKIDLFLDCEKCFYIDRRLGVKRPPGYPFNLNRAVDELFKKEFDAHRVEGTPHPLMETYDIDAIPFAHEKMDEWRHHFKGVRTLHKPTNFEVFGAVDDLWQDPDGNVIVVDYKATSKDGRVGIDADWQISYKRQIEVYQWLLRQNDLSVNATGYFVYANGITDKQAFDGQLEFDITVIPYRGDAAWVDGALKDMKACLDSPNIPEADEDCDYCKYREVVRDVTENHKPQHSLGI